MITRLFSLIRKEFISIWRDPKSRGLIIIPPLLQLFIFAHAVTMEVKNIELGILDNCKTVDSRDLCSGFAHSKWFKKIVYVENEKEMNRKLDNTQIMMALEIPPDFSRNLKSGHEAPVRVILDGRQTTSAGIMNGYAANIINNFNQRYAINNGQNGASVTVMNINWFNPNLEYLWYTLVSITTMLSVSTTLLLTALTIAAERELGTFEQLVVSPLKPVEILLGKTAVPLFLSIILTLIMILLAKIFFDLPFYGNIFVLIFSTFIALLSIVGIGLFISSISLTQQQAMLGVFTFQMPSVLLSGFVSPIEDMPAGFQFLARINPLTYHMVINKGLFLKGMQWADVFANLIPLAVIAAVTLTAASVMFRIKLD